MTNMVKLRVRRWAWLAVMVLALGTACDSDTTGPAPTPAPVDMVQVSPSASVLEVGATRRYSARAFAADGAELFGLPVAWSASSDVVTVSENGLVTAVKPGYADVTATVDGVSAAVGLTVPTPEPQPEPVASVLVTPAAALVEVGTATQYSARAFAQDGSELFGRPVEWSANGDAVSVSPGGVVNAVKAGYADVIATVEGVAAAVGVTVMPLEAPSDPVAYVIVAPGETAVFQGLYVGLRAVTLGPTGGTLTGRDVTWSSESPHIALVGADGLVLGVAAGTARIRAESEGKVGYATVRVREIPSQPQQMYGLEGTMELRVPFIQIGGTTWTDSTGAELDAYWVVRGGTLVLDTSSGRYSQSFMVETRLLGSAPDTEPAETRSVTDEGEIHYDFMTGDPILRSSTRPGTELRGQWLAAGEFVLPQSVLGTPSRPWVWALQ